MPDITDIKGLYEILFVGSTIYIRVTIVNVVVDSTGRPLFLIGLDEVIYNWSNIVIMKKVK